jgi:hypothetical protein
MNTAPAAYILGMQLNNKECGLILWTLLPTTQGGVLDFYGKQKDEKNSIKKWFGGISAGSNSHKRRNGRPLTASTFHRR